MLARIIFPYRGVPSFALRCGGLKDAMCVLQDHTDYKSQDRKTWPALPFVLCDAFPKIIALLRDRRGWECIRLGLVREGVTKSSVICISDLTAPSLPRRAGGTAGVCTKQEGILTVEVSLASAG